MKANQQRSFQHHIFLFPLKKKICFVPVFIYLFDYTCYLVIEDVLLPSLVPGTENPVTIKANTVPALVEFAV